MGQDAKKARRAKLKQAAEAKAREEIQRQEELERSQSARFPTDPAAQAMALRVADIAESIHPYGEPKVQQLLAALRGTEYEAFAIWLAKNITR